MRRSRALCLFLPVGFKSRTPPAAMGSRRWDSANRRLRARSLFRFSASSSSSSSTAEVALRFADTGTAPAEAGLEDGGLEDYNISMGQHPLCSIQKKNHPRLTHPRTMKALISLIPIRSTAPTTFPSYSMTSTPSSSSSSSSSSSPSSSEKPVHSSASSSSPSSSNPSPSPSPSERFSVASGRNRASKSLLKTSSGRGPSSNPALPSPASRSPETGLAGLFRFPSVTAIARLFLVFFGFAGLVFEPNGKYGNEIRRGWCWGGLVHGLYREGNRVFAPRTGSVCTITGEGRFP